MNIIFFGTPIFARIILERLFEKENIIAIFTQPDKPRGRGKKIEYSPVKEFALEKGIKLFQPDNLKSKEVEEIILELKPDILVVASYGKIIPEKLLKIPPYGGINVHASLLPKYRGASPIERALWNCEEETGVCIMQMEKGLDTGPVWSKKKIKIEPEDNRETLTLKLANLGSELLLETLPMIKEGKIKPIPQDDSHATYASKISPSEEKIDWNNSVKRIWSQIRALSPEPGAYTYFRGNILKILKAYYSEEKIEDFPLGSIILIDKKKGFAVRGIDGILWILEVKPENKKRISAIDFINGYRLNIGEKLE
ncbi:MAG: methionyl-tRNA formyltransferase [Dictyoglomaceae bacterium]|nr:methionyl-tRNA formyltransferase [Dictyoglomaceae bacterium]